mgnify:CR=1 FL=1
MQERYQSHFFKGSVLLICCVVLPCFAASYGYGQVSNLMFKGTLVVAKMMRIVCWITGGALFLGSLIKYNKYRQNPVEVRFSSVVSMLVTSLALIALGFVPMFAGVGAP